MVGRGIVIGLCEPLWWYHELESQTNVTGMARLMAKSMVKRLTVAIDGYVRPRCGSVMTAQVAVQR